MITLYTKDFCIYCTHAKQLLTTLKIPFTEIDVTNDDATLMKIRQLSNRRTLPQIFVNQTCIGGYTDIAALHEKGELFATIEKLSTIS